MDGRPLPWLVEGSVVTIVSGSSGSARRLWLMWPARSNCWSRFSRLIVHLTTYPPTSVRVFCLFVGFLFFLAFFFLPVCVRHVTHPCARHYLFLILRRALAQLATARE
ncbi:hypothetical protein IF2G_11073 [Cordyceps javanica]|nr:hypothetical protein IF2G_11073 [Cordyceps javanica]